MTLLPLPLPRRDPARLAQLRRLMVLDSSPEVAYDDITRLLAVSLEVPIALVNLLDAERDWFKSVRGLPYTESAITTSFCETFFQHQRPLMVVPDTAADPAFAQHPLVAGEPHVRFYAAARLQVHGHTVGTLCAYDFRPHQLDAERMAHITALAQAAVDLLMRRNSVA